MADCIEVPKRCQSAGARKPIVLDYTVRLQNLWTPGEVRQVDEAFRPRRATGFQYKTTNSGQAGATEPRWRNPETAGRTYQDGSLSVVAEAISNTSLANTIASSTWTGPDGITIDGEGIHNTGGEQKTFCYVEGGTPGTYRIRNDVVYALNGETDSVEIDIEIE
ncbi:MAG TPA: hypothetical protein VD932_04045 [Aquabacterium sp.]|nr:hypothetical protein [Aquabacterium sp.]